MSLCSRQPTLKRLFLLVSIWTPLISAHAQSPESRLTLGKAVALARANAPAVQAAGANGRVGEAALEIAGLLPNPTMILEAENAVGTGPYARFGSAETTYSLSMPLELGGKRAARLQVARAELAFGKVGVQTAEADLTLRVTQAFITLAASERRLTVANTVLGLAHQAEAAAQARVRAGRVSPIDEQRAQVQRVNAQLKADRALRRARSASESLARLINTPGTTLIAAPWFDNTEVDIPTERSGNYLALAAADATVAAANARMDVARRARVPDLTLTVGTRHFKEAGERAMVFGLSMPLPIFNSGSAELARARAELDKSQAERKATALDIEQVVADTQADVADARATAVAANGPAIAAATEVARIARLGYAEGKFSQLDLIEAERSLAETQEAAIEALAALHEARARLARLHGSTTPIYKN